MYAILNVLYMRTAESREMTVVRAGVQGTCAVGNYPILIPTN